MLLAIAGVGRSRNRIRSYARAIALTGWTVRSPVRSECHYDPGGDSCIDIHWGQEIGKRGLSGSPQDRGAAVRGTAPSSQILCGASPTSEEMDDY